VTSLRRQLTRWLLCGSALFLAAASALLYWAVSTALLDEYDAGLVAKAHALSSLLELDGEFLEFEYNGESMPEYELGEGAEAFVLWFDDGSEATRSASLEGQDALPLRHGPVDAPEFWDQPLADGRAGRALGVRVPVYPEEVPEELVVADLPHVVIAVARSREALDARLASVRLGLLGACAAGLLLVWWGVTLCVRRGLEPVRRLGSQVARLDATTLGEHRFDADVPDELLPFARRLDELLDRLEDAFGRQRRMTAAMAHELRTPIAELRSASDVARAWPDDAELEDALLTTADDVSRRMGRAVDAVMRYCRVESGEAAPVAEPLCLGLLLDDLWGHHAGEADERGLVFVNDVPSATEVVTDPGLLTVVLENLLHNAASFAPPGQVTARCELEGEVLELELANAAGDLGPADVAHLAEPFWRKDQARADGRHSGLGLALVAAVAQALDHRLGFAVEGGRFVVRLGFPTAAAPSPAARNGS
jgi:signal transduction histidine kinase